MTKGEGGQKSQKIDDVFYEQPLTQFFHSFQVVLSACVLSLVFTGSVQMCQSAKTSSQPHRLVPLANGMSQLAMTLSLLMIAVILPMLAQLR